MIVFLNFNGGQSNWYVAPLMMFLPLLLNSGINYLAETIMLLIVGTVGNPNSWLARLLEAGSIALVLGAVYHLWRKVSATRIGQQLQQQLFTGMSGGSHMPPAAAPAAQQRPVGQQHQQQQMAQQRQQRWEMVVRALHQLPTYEVATRQELEQQPIHTFKKKVEATRHRNL
eukprot:GHRR01008367.1.p1 GENE.GHRR01008367.1~~GHRR01008367.1.p1  ORF type:complete len:171 (+),score=87.89 GHRR01008367.1:201-713(+)